MAFASSAIAEPPSGYSYKRPSSFGGGSSHGSSSFGGGYSSGGSFSSGGGGGGYSSGGCKDSDYVYKRIKNLTFSLINQVMADFPQADFHQAVSEADMAVVDMAVEARDTNKSQSVIHPTKEPMSIKNCCTKLRRFFFNKRIWEEVEADMVDIQAGVMEEDMESHQVTDHLKSHPAMAHLDMARAASLALISDMSFRDTKLLNT